MRLVAHLVHEERAAELDLKGVDARGGAAEAFGDMATGIGPVDADAEPLGRQHRPRLGHELGIAAAAEAVAQGDIDEAALLPGRSRRHRVAVDEEGAAGFGAGALEHRRQRGMVGVVNPGEAVGEVGGGELSGIDRALADPRRHDAEAGAHPAADARRQPTKIVEARRVELVLGAVEVDNGAVVAGGDEHRPGFDRGPHEPVDRAVLERPEVVAAADDAGEQRFGQLEAAVRRGQEDGQPRRRHLLDAVCRLPDRRHPRCRLLPGPPPDPPTGPASFIPAAIAPPPQRAIRGPRPIAPNNPSPRTTHRPEQASPDRAFLRRDCRAGLAAAGAAAYIL